MDAVCQVCGQSFNYKNSIKTECCSRSCAAKQRHMKTSEKICEYCGKHFQGHPNEKYCPGPHYKTCRICGKPYEIQPGISEPEFCSSECRMKNYNQKIKDLYGEDPRGSESAKTQRANTMIERHGAKTTWESPELQVKVRATMVQKYGGKTTLESEELRAKAENTVKERYGVNNPLQLRHRVEAGMMSKYGVRNPMLDADILIQCKQTRLSRYDGAYESLKSTEKRRNTNIEKYGVSCIFLSEDCPRSKAALISGINRKFGHVLNSLNISYEYEHRIQGYSYDLIIPSTNTLIEIDPTYTHNLIGNHWGSGVANDYHFKKTKAAIDAGYRCIHIFDWDAWDKIFDMIIPKEILYARKCELKKIVDCTSIDKFLNQNHIQGTCRGQNYIYGLYYQGELVQCMTFGNPRYNKKFQYELLRLASDSRYGIVGGANRLFKAFLREQDPNSIISYCDRAKFSGRVYNRLGMTHLYDSTPAKVWAKGSQRVTDNLLRQRGYDQIFKTNFGKGASNEDLMLKFGWLPVVDCGQSIWAYNKPSIILK